MQKQTHDGALAEPEPEPSAEPEPKPETVRALHRAPPANRAVGAGLPAPRGARPARQGGEEREAGELFQAVVRVG
eukprot:scaffold36314_cov73-Phaeocystis_antarctica.AAC.2